MFENISRNDIINGIEDFDKKGYPDGFGPSTTYDIFFEGQKYPPPSIMYYAYYNAENKFIDFEFKVGKGSECFVAIERCGFKIVPKEHILWHEAIEHALAFLGQNVWDSKHNSTKYNVLDKQGNAYPPKRVFHHAAEYVESLYPEIMIPSLTGGEATNNFLRKYGYKVVEKNIDDMNQLEQELRKKYKNIWRCADSFKWDILKKYDLLTFDWLDVNVDYRKINIKELKRGKRAIDPWVNKMIEGDLVFIMGKNQYNGIAIIESRYTFNENVIDLGSNGLKPSVKISYLHKLEEPINHGLSTHNNPTTFASINAYKFSLIETLKMLQAKAPEAIESLKNTLDIDTLSNFPDKKLNIPLNQIFYGPPGTGKTYNTILEAAKIVTQNEDIVYYEAQMIFNNNLGDQIEFITFHQNYSYEDFIQGLRPDVEAGGTLSFFKSDGVFKKIADRALKNYRESNTKVQKKKDFSEVFEEFIFPLVEGEVDEIEIKMRKVSFFITNIKDKSIEFRKTSGGTDHTLSIGTLEEMYDRESIKGIKGLASYYKPLLEELLNRGKLNETEHISRKNYVIIIDEINRANISRVFGELITLIEKDKRLGGKIPLTATLPSGEQFIVPSNLYIIGTMNTADKSIALLDIALRRRFEFVPMYPNSESTEDKTVNDPNILEAINKEIITRKGHDFTIGHSYFMGEDYELKNTIDNKVIPLLLEYFMNDHEEVKKILSAATITVDGWPMQYIAND